MKYIYHETGIFCYLDVGLSPEDPAFIGCWWLGFIIFGSLCALFAFPLFFFPRHTAYYYNNKKLKEMEKDEEETIISFIKGFYSVEICVLLQSIICNSHLLPTEGGIGQL